MSDFFVLLTHDKRESSVVNALDDQGRDVYFPRILKHVRRGKRLVDVSLPFLPGHVFVADDGCGVEPLLRVPGVRDVLRWGGAPMRVPSWRVSEMQRREGDAGFVRLDDASTVEHGSLFNRIRGDTRVTLFKCWLRPVRSLEAA